MRAVEAALRAGAAVGEHGLDELDVPEAGGGAQVAREDAARGDLLRRRALAPEQRDDQRRAAVAARVDVDGRARVEQEVDEQRQPGGGRLVQRRPAVRVPARGVGAALEQQRDEPLVARRGRQPDQVVPVRPFLADEPGRAVEQGPEPVDVVRLDRAERGGERLVALAQRRHVAQQRVPVLDAVLGGEHGTRALFGERGVAEEEGVERGRGAVAGGGEQSVGAVLVVLGILLVEALRHPGTLPARQSGRAARRLALAAPGSRRPARCARSRSGPRERRALTGSTDGGEE